MKKFSGILFALVLVVSLTLVPAFADSGGAADTDSFGCTDILVGNEATVDGSTIGTYSCDGARYARIQVVPGATYPPDTMTPIYYRPFPGNYEQYLEYLDKAVLKGWMPQVEETYRYVTIRVWYSDSRQASINEYGVTVGETTIGGRGALRNSEGLLSAYSFYEESSLMSLACQRAKTAREAIEVMGSLAEDYGYYGTHGPEHITVSDGNEIWAFEIFGPGPSWEGPESDEPGALWCAQRIPDGEVGVSANRSRIGEVPVEENDYFMFSDNIRDLAEEMGWWDGVEPFVWHEAYAPRTSRNLREWEALNLVAPSLNLDPDAIHQPFSVVPDELLTVQDVMAMHRDAYEGTEFDSTEDPAWYYEYHGELVKSPLACPFGTRDLHRLLGVSAQRSIATPSSVFSYVSQVRADLPDPIKGVMWFGFGPAATTCYVPIYSGVTELPESWGATDVLKVNRLNAWWAFNLVDHLALIKWQYAIEDIKGVRDPAEACFFAQQPDFEKAIVKVFRHPKGGQAAAEELVTDYTNACMNAASEGYWDLVDYLLFKYYSRVSSGAPQELPSIDCPPVPPPPVPFPVKWTPAVKNGFGDPNNVFCCAQAVFDDYLYAGTYNEVTGGEIWRTSDGITWTQVNIDGFGDPNNFEALLFEVFDGNLYAGTYNEVTGTEIWRTSDGITWTQVNIDGFGDPNNIGTELVVVFDGSYYAGTYNEVTGGEIWRTSDGITWTQVNIDGFGDPNNASADPYVFDGNLYAGTYNEVTGGEIWRSSDGITWTQVNIDGFGDPNNVETYPSVVFDGNLYAGTGNDVTGAEIWRSSDGITWTQVNIDGFGDPNNIWGYPYVVFDGNMYLGTGNDLTGTEIWRSSDGITWTQVNIDGFGDPNNVDSYPWSVFDGSLYVGTANDVTGGEVWRGVVIEPQTLKTNAISELEAAKTGDEKIDKKLDHIIGDIQKSLNIDPMNPQQPWKEYPLWVDDSHLNPQHGHMVFDKEKEAVKKIQELISHEDIPDSVKDACQDVINKLVKADELLAEISLEDAKAYAGTSKQVDHQIAIAEQELLKAEEKLAKDEPDKAIDHYKKAWRYAQDAMS